MLKANRGIIKISGPDAAEFLQGLITKNIHKAKADESIYCFFLTPQGKIISDIFIYNINDAFLLDLPQEMLNEVLKKFKMYKLKSNLTIDYLDDTFVYISKEKLENSLSLPDPRLNELGFRSITSNNIKTSDEYLNEYHKIRITHKIPDWNIDLETLKFFPLYINSDFTKAIDFDKGCYVGQEVTARMKYKSTLKKAIYLMHHKNGVIAEKFTEITLDSRPAGVKLGSFNDISLAMLERQEYEINSIFQANDEQLLISVTNDASI